MPTATTPPRCPHRVVKKRLQYWLAAFFVSLFGTATTTTSLHGQELDYRFVEPAGHMQPWPVEEAEVILLPPPPVSVQTPRVAAKWRTNLTAPREQKEPKTRHPLPGPIPVSADNDTGGDTGSDTGGEVEVLVVPQRTDDQASSPPKNLPASNPRDCYQAPPLSALSLSTALPAGKLPTNAAAECAAHHPPVSDARLAGAWTTTEHHWSATCSRHRPLYFEEINAERYGYTVSYALQPVISAARFFATIPALPYKMAVKHPRACVYTLGHYRPGSCAPRRWNRLPWQLTAGVVEVGFIAGLILLVP